MWLRSNDDDQASPTRSPLLYLSSIAVSGWGCTPCAQLRKSFGSKAAARCIQGRVSVYRFLIIRPQRTQLKAHLHTVSSDFFWDSLLRRLTQPIVWWMSINRRPPSFKRVSRNFRQPPSRLAISTFNLLSSYSSEQVSTHLKRIEAVEKDLKSLGGTTVTKDDFVKLRTEVKKLYAGLHIGLSLNSCELPQAHQCHLRRILRFEESCLGHPWVQPFTCHESSTNNHGFQSKIYKRFQKKSEVPFD